MVGNKQLLEENSRSRRGEEGDGGIVPKEGEGPRATPRPYLEGGGEVAIVVRMGVGVGVGVRVWVGVRGLERGGR